ncbi:MAG TPA: hypothetical protein VK145_00095 [Candidatus Nanoarchaeia archaeon]|nr:hypothetical protein [Candidatus Nanoarchaeia archaeon]
MITQNRILFAIGMLVVLMPFLGFPSPYESFFTAAAGVAIIILAFMYARNKRLHEIHHEPPKVEVTTTEVFVESRPRFASDDEVEVTDLASIRDRSRHIRTF